MSKKERQRTRTGHKGREGPKQGGNDFPKAPCLPKLDRIRPSFGQGAKGAKGAFFENLFAPGAADSPKLIQTNSTLDIPLTPLHPYHVQQSKDLAVSHPPLDTPLHLHAILHARTLVQAALPNNMTHSTLTVQHPNHPDPVQQGRDSPKMGQMGQMGQTGGRLNFKTAPESQSWLSFGWGRWGRWGSYLRKRPSTPKVADSPNLIQINSTPDIS